MMAQTLIPEAPSPGYLSKAVAASFVHLPSKLGKRVIKYVQMDLLTRHVPSCLHCVIAALSCPDESPSTPVGVVIFLLA